MAKAQKKSSRPKKKSPSAKREKISLRVEKKIKPASELPQNVRMLIYGRPGAGKTRLAATAPKLLLVDINEKGWDSVRRDFDPNTFPCEYWSEIDDVYWYLATADHDYESVVIDSVTQMQSLCLKFVMGDEASRDASRDPDMPSRQIWGKVGELMKTQITNFRNLPMNVIFTARQRSRSTGEDDAGDVEDIVIAPNCSPTVADYLEGAVPLIGHLTQREVRLKTKAKSKKRRTVLRRRMLVGPSDRYITKERYGVFGSHIDAPDIAEMIDLIYKYGKEVD